MGGACSSPKLTAEQLAGRVRTARVTGVMSLKGCDLRDIPAEVLALGPRLHTLDLSGNRGISLEGVLALTGLKKLIMAGCALKSLPAWTATSLPKLETLDLARNELRAISTLPAAALKALNLSENRLVAFPSAAVAPCTLLEELNISGNEFEPSDSPVLPPELFEWLPGLRELSIARCGVATLVTVNWTIARELRTLDAGGNLLFISHETIPRTLLTKTKLSKLVLAGNPDATQRAVMALPGFDEFAPRRKARLDKVIAGGFSKDHDLLSG